jgi:hypothetical protein
MNTRISMGVDDKSVPVTPLLNTVQTPGTERNHDTSSSIGNAHISTRQEMVACEIAHSSALNDYETFRSKPKSSLEYFGAEFVRNPDGE